MTETYEFSIGVRQGEPFSTATYYAGQHFTFLDEWTGRSLEDFHHGMEGRGFHHSVDHTLLDLPGYTCSYDTHTYTRTHA